MATRLDRLWVLLESGSTPVIRKAAAYQIGEIQKLHPHELHNLLKKVSKYLHSTAWETRIAAAHAIEAIARNVKKWDPPLECKMESDVKSDDSSGDDHQLSFDTFNIQQVLDHGVPLLSSTGDEFNKLEDDPDYQKMTQQEKMAFHRQQLKQKLGLVAQGKVFSTGLEQLFDDSDLIITSSVHQQAPRRTKQLVDVSELNALTGMSAREKNRAKRKAKMAAKKNKQNDKDCINDGQSSIGPPSAKKLKTSSVVVEQAGDSDKVLIDQVADEESLYDNSEEWPFTWFCQEMFHLLFNPQWEVRHGAASALREIIKLHGDTANIQASTPIGERKMKTQEWLSDVAIRLLCVFALDRFADFISDQVVAPVRATCAQVLGTICNQLDDDRLSKVVDILLVLGQQGLWEVRYAMLMGLQHVLAARMDVALSLLPVVSDSLLNSLQDADDDVRAVAAGALLPVAHQLNVIFIDKLPLLFQILWDCLLQLDDLSASTSSVMDLLACLLSNLTQDQFALLILESSLIGLVPRIYPFMYHRILSVRESCLKTLKSLMMGKKEWIQQLMDTLFVHLFQRLAFEGDASIRSLIFQVWEMILDSSDGERLSSIMSRYLIKWLSVLATPPTSCVDPSLIEVYSTKDVYLGGILDVEAMNIREQAYFTARVNNMKALGMLAMKVSPSSVQYLSETLNTMLATTSAVFKELLSLFVSSWANCPHDVADKLTSLLTESCIYDEVQPFLLSLQKDSYVLVTALEKKGIEASGGVNPSLYTVDFVVQLATTIYSNSMESLKLTSDERQDLEGFHRNLLTSLGQFQEQHQKYQIKIQCCTAGALITLHKLPPKLNPLIRPLMDSLKTHPDHFLQSLSAGWLSQLLDQCHGRSPCPNPKIIKNICSFLCCDPDITPSVLYDQANALTKRSLSPEEDENGKNNGMVEESDNGSSFNWRDGILSLKKATAKVNQMKRGPGRPSAAIKESLVAINESQAFNIQRSGGELAMTALGRHFGDELFTKLPDIWSIISEPLANIPAITDNDVLNEDVAKIAQNIINSLQILEVFAPVVHKGLKDKFLSLLPSLLSCIISNFTAVRHMGARATAAIAMQHLHQVMEFVMDEVILYLGDTNNDTHRQGAVETISYLLQNNEMDILCYIVLLVMPILGRMSDQDVHVRLMASQCFAKLVSLMSLESGVDSPAEMSVTLAARRVEERKFLEQLLDTSKLENYKVPVPIKADLRKYQQDGINWLAFLNKYQLHGILCDDMGLGKTLQSICIIAGDHYNREQNYKMTGNADSVPLPSIVICPPTLTGHWLYEVKKFCSLEYLNPIQYVGSPNARAKLQKIVPKHNFIIVSYDIVRNDIDFFKEIHWNYCVLDEGHIIKNTKTKITKAIKLLKANHRLILSGTPIQNNVLELWSLFDFLMPGFLGTERQFNERYGRPILLSRDAKSSSKEQEAANRYPGIVNMRVNGVPMVQHPTNISALAMESLHKQVLPFLLRRMKEDVLQDLPPKIIQDYHCDLSPLQVILYEDFAKSNARKKLEDKMEDDDDVHEEKREGKDTSQIHVLQALQYLRKVCNHPVLVASPEHPLYDKVMQYLAKDNTTLHDISHSAKLLALKQLLHECGLGVSEVTSDGLGSGVVVSQHRVLLFCQYKMMLDVIENDLLKVHMPSVTYLRLDGSVPAGSRHNLVHRFNGDPSIDLLLLTTHVGGLGLNLTGADTVIFFEHDWNPMKDLQAMDRAHRIGQKKVVNVYRLITRGTLEEKIMSLQKFKLNIANTVVSQDNSSLLSMDTSGILDLFHLGEDEGSGGKASGSRLGGSGLKNMIDSLPDLWDEDQYHNEYDLQNFMQSLKSTHDDN